MRRSAYDADAIRSLTQPTRRRRVMSTSASDDEETINTNTSRTSRLQHRWATEHGETNHSEEALDADVVIVVESSADEVSDRHRPAVRTDKGRIANVCDQPAGIQAHAISGNRVSRTRMPQSAANRLRMTPTHRTLQAEASETSSLTTEGSESSSCVETDTRTQYRDAILGVSNARQARLQMRGRTQVCPTCALFASFMGNFI